MNRGWTNIGATILLILSLAPAPLSATPFEDDPFDAIPKDIRASFASRLELLIELQKRQDWTALYDLLSEEELQGQTKKEYLKHKEDLHKNRMDDRLQKFDDLSVGPLEVFSARYKGIVEGSWIVSGCGKFKERGHLWGRSFGAMTIATYKDGEWYFTEITIMFEAVDGPPSKCK